MASTFVKVSETVWVEYDDVAKVSTVHDKTRVCSECIDIDARLAEIPGRVTDEQLLEWARANYREFDYSAEIESLNSRKGYLEYILSKLKG